VNKYAEKYFGSWKHGSYAPVIEKEPAQEGTRYVHVQQPGFPPYIGLNFKGPAFSDHDMDLPALNILATLLLDESGDLYQQLVIKEQKARSINGGAGLTRDPQLVSFSISAVKAADLQYLKDALMKALEKAKTVPIDPKKLADTKSNIKYSFAMRLDSPDQIANSMALYTWLTGNPESLNNYYALFDKVTATDIMNVAKKYFTPTSLTIATISPEETGNVK
jgi:zinc protease